MNPPLKYPDEDVLWAPNEITIDIPLHLHPTRVVLQSEPTGTGIGEEEDQSRPVAETNRFKKIGSYARFQAEAKKCPYGNTIQFYIFTKAFKDPISVDIAPFDCNQRSSK
jgi:hypothetical protein